MHRAVLVLPKQVVVVSEKSRLGGTPLVVVRVHLLRHAFTPSHRFSQVRTMPAARKTGLDHDQGQIRARDRPASISRSLIKKLLY